jgi:predicted RecB family nuclease
VFRTDDGWVLSATDLVDALECDHRIVLAVAHAARLEHAPAPSGGPDALVVAHGLVHEQRTVDALTERFAGQVIEIGQPALSVPALRAAAAQTRRAMDAGVAVIVQAVLYDEGFYGRADLLIRADLDPATGHARPGTSPQDGTTGAIRYEPYDTKLARHTKPGAVLQLTAYAAAIARTGRPLPEQMHLILGDGSTSSLRVAEYLPLLERIQTDLHAQLDKPVVLPSPTWGHSRPACAACPFSEHCADGREQARDLSLIAGIRTDQRRKLRDAGLLTLDALADADDDQRPSTLAERTFNGLRAQARLQRQQDLTRTDDDPTGTVVLDVHADTGLAMLPDPSPGDLFFDFEGDPYFAQGEGLEYLIGAVELTEADQSETFTAFWAHDRSGEKRMFEAFVDFVTARIAVNPQAHLYHYAPYEPTALKKLAQLHSTRESEVDDLLRDGRLIDLYAVVRKSLRVSQRSYSIKYLEPLYMDVRDGDVTNAGSSIEAYERYLALRADDQHAAAAAVLDDIEAYNTDDCVSTARLYAMLLGLRDERGITHTAPAAGPDDEARAQRRAELEAQTAALTGPLTADLPEDPAGCSGEQHARALLAAAVGYHRRETLPAWWEHFRMAAAPLSELEGDSDCAVPLEVRSEGWVDPAGRTKLYKRTLIALCDSEQPHPFRAGEAVRLLYAVAPGATPLVRDARVDTVDGDELTLTESCRDCGGGELPVAVLPGPPVNPKPKDAAVAALAGRVVATLPELPALPGVDLLLRRPPRLLGDAPLPRPDVDGGEGDLLEAVIAAVDALDGSCLPVQGPPGAGKTYLAGQLIRHLIGRGKSVGVCSNSHKAIENALRAGTGRRQAGNPAWQPAVPTAKKVSGKPDPAVPVEFEQLQTYAQLEAFRAAHPDGHVIGGTAWTMSHETLRADPVDYLIIDEAGQFALADALAVSVAARNIILLGDPQQLPQVVQGTHPAGAGASALGHVLGDDDVIGGAAGYFLALSRRMHPAVCAPVSALSYRGLLHAHPSAAHRAVDGLASGLHSLLVPSHGCTTANPDEVAAVVRVVGDLLGRIWTDEADASTPVRRPLRESDILIVAPFNRMVRALSRTLADAGFAGVRVGTVDKFQGQEAPVVLTALTASAAEDLPRGLEFLLSRNRLNVALSRAQALSVLICSPALARTAVTTVEQMRLVSGLAGLLNAARAWPGMQAGAAPPAQPAACDVEQSADHRRLGELLSTAGNSVDLVVTSPPYQYLGPWPRG